MTIQLELDLDRADQQAANCDAAMRNKGVPAVQRAVLIMLLTHPHANNHGDQRSLTIALRPAAGWMRQHVPAVANLTCDHTAAMRALQLWIDRGVAAVTQNGSRRTLWLSVTNLRRWHGAQPDADELPLFGNMNTESSVVHGGDSCCSPVHGGDSRCMVVHGGASQREEEEESILLHQSSETHQDAPAGTDEQQLSPVGELLLQLPDLPSAVWHADRTDQSLLQTVMVWWDEHNLADRFGDQAREVAAGLVGLLLKARSANSPPAYFSACCRRGLRHHVITEGRAFIDQTKSRQHAVAR